jgi:signal transduction histidine kinase
VTRPAHDPLDLDRLPLPVWVYAPEANAFRWANAAGLAFWGAGGLAALRARDLSDIRAQTRTRLAETFDRLAEAGQLTETWTVYPGGLPRTVTCTTWRTTVDGEACLAFMALPADGRQPARDARQRDDILQAVAQTAERLLGGGDQIAERDWLLAELGRAAQVDRAYAFIFHPPKDPPERTPGWLCSQVFEWCAPGIAPEIDNPELQNLPLDTAFPRWVERFQAGLPMVAAGREQLPAAERAILDPQGITAICVHPILCDGRPVGFIGFDIVGATRAEPFPGWSSGVVDALATGAHLIGAAQQMETTRRQLHDALVSAQNASRAKSNFLANMSHELRTPLNAIIGFSEMLQSEPFGPLGSARYRGYAGDIQQSGRHLLGLINDVLDLAKAEAGRMTLSEDVGALYPDVVAPCLTLLQARAEAGRIPVAVASDLPHVAVHGDLRKLVQVLANLLTNAVKFSAPGSPVRLSGSRTADGGLALRVADRGCGMTAAEAEMALEPFTQVGGIDRQHHEGTGLGLPLARKLTELHGGTLAVHSAPGDGTTVTVKLPANRVVGAVETGRAGGAELRLVHPPAWRDGPAAGGVS